MSRASSHEPATPSSSPNPRNAARSGSTLRARSLSERVGLRDHRDPDQLPAVADVPAPGPRSSGGRGRRRHRSTPAAAATVLSPRSTRSPRRGRVGRHDHGAVRPRRGRPRWRCRPSASAGRTTPATRGRCPRSGRLRTADVPARFSAAARSRAPRVSRKSASVCRTETTLETASTAISTVSWSTRNCPAREMPRPEPARGDHKFHNLHCFPKSDGRHIGGSPSACRIPVLQENR